MSAPLLSATGISKTYTSGDRRVVALDDISITVAHGQTLGLVGPSGSGKSTLARILLRLVEPDAGRVDFGGADLLALRGEALRTVRRRIQMVFQDPLAAFNPRATVGGALADPLRVHGIADRDKRPSAIAHLLERVGLRVVAAGKGLLTGPVTDVIFVGSMTHIRVAVGQRELQIVIANDGDTRVPVPGSIVGIDIPPDAVRLLPC